MEEWSEDEEKKAELGIGRSYECVFCKRGFNTAQALGGHMNIHRKDRARINKPNHHQICYSGPRPPTNQDHHHPILTYASFFPESARPSDGNGGFHYQNGIRGDWRLSLTMPADLGVGINEEKDLDLELRLGYNS